MGTLSLVNRRRETARFVVHRADGPGARFAVPGRGAVVLRPPESVRVHATLARGETVLDSGPLVLAAAADVTVRLRDAGTGPLFGLAREAPTRPGALTVHDTTGGAAVHVREWPGGFRLDTALAGGPPLVLALAPWFRVTALADGLTLAPCTVTALPAEVVLKDARDGPRAPHTGRPAPCLYTA